MRAADRNSPLLAAPDPAVPQHRLVRRPRRADQSEGQTQDQDQDQDVHLYMLLLPHRSRLQRPGRRSRLYGPEQAEAERRRRRRGGVTSRRPQKRDQEQRFLYMQTKKDRQTERKKKERKKERKRQKDRATAPLAAELTMREQHQCHSNAPCWEI